MDLVVDFECLQDTSNIIILNDLVLRDGFVILMFDSQLITLSNDNLTSKQDVSFIIMGGPKPNIGCLITLAKTMDNSFSV